MADLTITRRALLAGGAAGAASGRQPQPRPASTHVTFPKAFALGVSSSAYQIEGATLTDGRGEGIWDRFCANGRASLQAESARACDHYHRYRDDLALIANNGLRHYRFSVSWPRLFPAGDGRRNAKGFDFYDRLIDTMLEHRIDPWLCLYHWDLPQALQDLGGWTNRDTAARYADFVAAMGRHYGDRVPNWVLSNEANVQAALGYGFGQHAPGTSSGADWMAALHHFNLAHGMGIRALRAAASHGKISLVTCYEPVLASFDTPQDRKAAAQFDAIWNDAPLMPLFHGTYPDAMAHLAEKYCLTGDMTVARGELDMLGINYYSRLHIQANPNMALGAYYGPPPGAPRLTVMGWPIEPDGLLESLLRLRARYGHIPVFIAENGYSTRRNDTVGADIDDQPRIDYIAAHLDYAHRALQHGIDLRGFFVWSLMDCFEWNDGYRWRFGMVAVDPATMAREPKKSFAWYSALARAHSAT